MLKACSRVLNALLLTACLVAAQNPPNEAVEQPGKRDVIEDSLDVARIREISAKDVGEALTLLDGFWKIRKAGIGNDVVLRGFQQDDLNLLIDGARIYGACPGNMDPAAFHVDFAEVREITVTKGAFDVSSAGSLGGLVRVTNKAPGPGVQIAPNFAAASFGFVNPALTASLGTNSVQVLGGYSFRTSEPYQDGLGKRFTAYANYRNPAGEDTAFRIHTGWTQVWFSPAHNHEASLSYTRQQSGPALYPYLLMDATADNADRVNATYQVRSPWRAVKRVNTQGYYTAVRHTMNDAARMSAVGALAAFSMATDASTRTYGGRVEAELTAGVLIGFEAFQRNWNALNFMRMSRLNLDQAIVPDVNTTAAGLFAEYSADLTDRIRLVTGIRFDHTSMNTASNADTTLYFSYYGTRQISRSDKAPSGNLRFSFALPRSLELFAGFGSTVRTPDAQERFFSQRRMGQDWVGNPLLRPTRNNEADIGLTFRRGAFYVRAIGFYSTLTDHIVVNNVLRRYAGAMNSAARSYANADARIWGGEWSGGVGRGNWAASTGVSYVRGDKNPAPSEHVFDSDLAEMPPLKSWAKVRYGSRRVFSEFALVGAGAQRHVDSDLRETPTPGYLIMNFKLGWHAKDLLATIGVDNLANRYYFEHFSYNRDPFRSGVIVPEPGRSLSVSITYSFSR